MRNRKLITLAAAVVTLFALSGCSLNSEVESLRPYAPSDGVQSDVDSLKSRNLMFIRNDNGQAMLIGSFINSSQDVLQASIETLDSNGDTVRFDFSIDPGAKYDIGYNGNPGLVLAIDDLAGSMRNIFVTAEGDPFGKLVPVLDGTLEEYRSFVEDLN